MELEEMKTLWGEMSAEIEKQKKLTDSLILKMTGAGYRNKISNILIPELIGAGVCFASVIFILVNFHKLNTPYLLVFGMAAALILVLLPLLSLHAIYKMRSVNISVNNYKQSLLQYSKGKIQFMLVQKLSFYLGSILLVVILPLMAVLMGGKDLFKETKIWLWYAVAFPIFYMFARRVYKYYIRSANDAENILKELDN